MPAYNADRRAVGVGGSAPPDVLEPVTDYIAVGYEQDSVTILFQVCRVTLPAKQGYKMVSRGRLIGYSVDVHRHSPVEFRPRVRPSSERLGCR